MHPAEQSFPDICGPLRKQPKGRCRPGMNFLSKVAKLIFGILKNSPLTLATSVPHLLAP